MVSSRAFREIWGPGANFFFRGPYFSQNVRERGGGGGESKHFLRTLIKKGLKNFSGRTLLKDDVQSVLRISSAHNKGKPQDINIAQILYLSNFFELKRIVYIHLQT
jgi:hypothetical protein